MQPVCQASPKRQKHPLAFPLIDHPSADASFVHRVGNIPIVADGIGTFEYAIHGPKSQNARSSDFPFSPFSQIRRQLDSDHVVYVRDCRSYRRQYVSVAFFRASPFTDVIPLPQSLSMLPRLSSRPPLL